MSIWINAGLPFSLRHAGPAVKVRRGSLQKFTLYLRPSCCVVLTHPDPMLKQCLLQSKHVHVPMTIRSLLLEGDDRIRYSRAGSDRAVSKDSCRAAKGETQQVMSDVFSALLQRLRRCEGLRPCPPRSAKISRRRRSQALINGVICQRRFANIPTSVYDCALHRGDGSQSARLPLT